MTRTSPPKKATKAQRLAQERAFYTLYVQGRAFHDILEMEVRDKVPDAWHTLEQDIDVKEPREKVTLYLDRSVAKCFRAMGKGWHGRINWLLRTWVHMKAADLLKTEEFLRQMDEGMIDGALRRRLEEE